VFTVQGEGLNVVTVDVEFAGRQLREWTEALVRVRRWFNRALGILPV